MRGSDKTYGKYFLCRRSEAVEALQKARKEADKILEELKIFYTGDIKIQLYINEHVMGRSVAADLMVAGEVCRSYDPADLCFLELNELMMLRMLKTRKSNGMKSSR